MLYDPWIIIHIATTHFSSTPLSLLFEELLGLTFLGSSRVRTVGTLCQRSNHLGVTSLPDRPTVVQTALSQTVYRQLTPCSDSTQPDSLQTAYPLWANQFLTGWYVVNIWRIIGPKADESSLRCCLVRKTALSQRVLMLSLFIHYCTHLWTFAGNQSMVWG